MNARTAKETQDIVTGKIKRILTLADIKKKIGEHIYSESNEYFITIDLNKNIVLPAVVNQLKEENFEIIKTTISCLVNQLRISWDHA